jgi:hypothetical protein
MLSAGCFMGDPLFPQGHQSAPDHFTLIIDDLALNIQK